MFRALLSRRNIFSASGILGALHSWSGRAYAASLKTGPAIYQSIGVKPLINCKGTFTIISGSQSLPEVKAAMEAASRHYIHLDELMAAVGQRLSELTQAEWGMVSNGCAAALSHATAACIAGADPERLQRIPNLTGLKNEVISPAYSRNVYDHAVRATGAHVVTVNTLEEYRRAFNSRTAMVMILAGPGDRGPLGLDKLAPLAKERGVPVLVDAAAERLTIPNVHLAAGADLVAYSGGKCLRGPQAAGLLLGRKDLVQAAWLHSAPHHAFGRSMKAGKEEIIGMLAAVEMWVKRDHKAEWAEWESWLSTIATAVKAVNGVSTEILQPDSISNNAPQLRIKWDGEQLGVCGKTAEKLLLDGEPRIIVGGAMGHRRTGVKESSLTIMPYMMMPGDAAIAARRISELLAKPPREDFSRPAPAVNVAGQWDVEIEFLLGRTKHRVMFEQRDNGALTGSHFGETLSADLRGTVEGREVWFRSSHRYEGTAIGYEFTAQLDGDSMAGQVEMGEYGKARFTARRHAYAGGRA
jgi:D-glucosaminate-6-phosphate ammonia-lyase